MVQAGVATSLAASALSDEAENQWQPRYIIGSCLYGYTSLAEIVPEVTETDATAIDIWPMVHGNQREQLDELGEGNFAALLQKHGVKLGCITQYKLGPKSSCTHSHVASRSWKLQTE